MNLKEFKQNLAEQYPFRIEMHAHTKPISGCSEILPEEMVEIYSQKGYDAVVITNHFIPGSFGEETKDEYIDKYLKGYEDTVKAAEKYSIKIFLGAEIRFRENNNDYLLFGVDREILSLCYDYCEKGVELFRKEVKLPNSVFIQAHPFRNGMSYCDPALLDGIESFNMHPGHNSRIGIAARFAYENGISIQTAGSDFHHKNQGH